MLHGTPKFFLKGKRKYFLLATDIISSEQLRKLEKIKPFGHSKAQKKNMTDIAHFPRPGQSDPYILTSLTKSYLWSCDAVRTEREETSASHFQLRKIYLKHLSSWKSDWRQSCSKIDIRWKVGKNFFSAEFNCSDHRKITIFLVESRSWRDWNLKFGPNCDLEVDNFFLKIIHLQITICGPNFKFRSCQLLLSV